MPTKSDQPEQEQTTSISKNLGIAISNGSGWITSADTGCIALAHRLAVALDYIFDTGEGLKDVPALAGRLGGLMQQLKLTPLSRDNSKADLEEIDHGQQYADAYLRLVDTPNPKPKSQGAKPRPASKPVSSRTRSTTTAVAKPRSK